MHPAARDRPEKLPARVRVTHGVMRKIKIKARRFCSA